MHYIRFEKAGIQRDHERVFLTSNNRKYRKHNGISHRNDFHTIITMHKNMYKKYFVFDKSSHIYRTELTWGELRKIAEIFTFKLY